jgi:hypothetical protein
MISSYPAVLVAGSISLVLLAVVWRQPGTSARSWFIVYNLLLAVTFLANYLLVGQAQLSPHVSDPNNAFNNTWREWFPARDPISLVWWFLKAHTGNMVAYPMGGPYFASSLTTVLCLAGAWDWWQRGNRRILALFAWPFGLSMIAAILHKYPYGGSARLDQHLAPAICLLMGNGIVFLTSRFVPASLGERRGAALVALLLTVFGAAGLVRDLVKPFKTTAELWNRTFVEDLMARVGANDRVVVFHAPGKIRPGLEWYLRQYDACTSWNGAVDWDRLTRSSGKLWCVQIYDEESPAEAVPVTVARSSRGFVEVEYYPSVAPPEHGDVPELAEVYCFERRSNTPDP